MKKIFFYLLIALYVLAGINHFWHPQFYLRLIPPYLPWHVFINYAAGVFEFVLGVMLIISATRRLASIGIVLMLIAFIPSHIYSIQIACNTGTGCTTWWISLIRFVVFQPLLIAWAWMYRNYKSK